MNMLKVTKWFGYSLLCLVILSVLLALAGLWVTRGLLDRFSQENHIQEDEKQIDMILSGWKLAQTVLDRGAVASEYSPSEAALPQTSTSRIDEQGAVKISEAKLDRAPAEPTSTGKDLDLHPNGVYRMGGIAAVDPNNGVLHPTGGIAAVDPNFNLYWFCPMGGIAAVDPNN